MFQPLAYYYDNPAKQARANRILDGQLTQQRQATILDVYELIATLIGSDEMPLIKHYLSQYVDVLNKAFLNIRDTNNATEDELAFVKELKRQARRYAYAYEPTFKASERTALENASDTANAEDLLRVAALYNPQDKRTRSLFRKQVIAPRILRALPDELAETAVALRRGSAYDCFGQDRFLFVATSIKRVAMEQVKEAQGLTETLPTRNEQ